jgi:glycosyltransferase involved in cell wall biosynthesis
MAQHYVFFTRNVLPQPRADLIQIINCANAAANLGYSAVLAYLGQANATLKPVDWVVPFRPKPPEQTLAKFYNLQQHLKVAPLPIPWAMSHASKWTNPSTIVCKYYFPLFIRPATKLVHTRDWNFVKAAIRWGIPAIYEHDHYAEKPFEPEIVNHPLFQMAVTVADPIRDSMIQHGMPSDKIVKLHNGFNQFFLIRHPEQAQAWRRSLLTQDYGYLAVYSGALYPFKGVDLLIEVAKTLPQVQFVFAGGNESQVAAYRQLANEQQAHNTRFLGHLPHEQLASLLQAADVLVHPHCSGEAATFTSPMKFFDYMASGTPIVATEIPPLLEFRTSGVVAGWCAPDNPVQLAQSIQRVFETHPRKPAGYINSIEFVRQFSWENRLSTLLSYVDRPLKPALVN